MLLDVNRISKSYGDRDVLKHISLRLGAGQKIGLVGRNGCGKTTLLRIIAGDEEPDAGHVRRSPPSLLVGHLPQTTRTDGARTVRDELVSAHPGDGQWWRAEKIAGGLGFRPDQWRQRVASLSGGEKTRLTLAKLLLRPHDVLLLDEPTNHLDISMLQWLEAWLSGHSAAAIIASHDRRFLDATVDRVVELAGGTLTAYPRHCSAYAAQEAHPVSPQ